MSNTADNNILDLVLTKLEEHEKKLELLTSELKNIKNELQKESKFQYSRSKNNEPIIEKNILVVDDNVNLLETYQLILQNAGFNVDTSNNALNALYKTRKNHYDLIIIDMNLPDMLGDDLVKRIREINHQIQIIMITGYSSYSKNSNIDVQKFIMKPIPPETLIDQIKNTLK